MGGNGVFQVWSGGVIVLLLALVLIQSWRLIRRLDRLDGQWRAIVEVGAQALLKQKADLAVGQVLGKGRGARPGGVNNAEGGSLRNATVKGVE